MQISVILPTYNERDNIIPLIKAIQQHLGRVEIIVVDDDSPDGTWKKVAAVAKKDSSIRLLRRIGRRGLATAISEGISMSKGDVITWMDCDFSHPPKLIPKLISALNGCDIAMGSRFVEGGGMEASYARVLLSRMINSFARFFLGGDVKDYTSGFLVVKKRVLSEVDIQAGYGEYCIALLYSAKKLGFKIREIPFIHAPRSSGETKTSPSLFTLLRHGMDYGLTILKLRFFS